MGCAASGEHQQLPDKDVQKPVTSFSLKKESQTHIFLKNVPLFQVMSADDINKLAQACEVAKFLVGETIIKKGDMGKEFFLVVEGQVGVYVGADAKSMMQVAQLQAGDYFGEAALLHDRPREATITASNEVKTLKITRAKFQELGLSSKVHFPARKAVGVARQNPKGAHSKDPTPKTPEDRKVLAAALLANKNLNAMVNLTAVRLDKIIDQMWKEKVPARTTLIKQGDCEAFFFYIVQAGEFEVIVEKQGGAQGFQGKRVKGESFGELAMLYSAPRAATVKATIDGDVWVIDRTQFKKVLMQEDTPERLVEYVQLLEKIPLFGPLLGQEREAVARVLVERTFKKGETIMTEGEPGVCMYIFIDGEVAETRASEKSSKPKLHKARTKDMGKTGTGKEAEGVRCFGERQLVSTEPRDRTVVAQSKCRALVMDRDAVGAILGEALEDVLRNAKEFHAAPERVFGKLHRRDLTPLGLLGCGGFGAVELVEHNISKDTFALKQLSKGYVVECNMTDSVMNEKNILIMADSPFIIKLFETYNGTQSLYFLLEAALGGELYATYNRRNLFGSEKHAKFYVAGAVCGFEYLHKLKIVYRDLKPENMILDIKGQVKLIDMGLAKVTVRKTYTTCGTPDYFAPEIITQTGHNHAVDWWCVGILTFELTAGSPPFEDQDPMQTYAKIKKGISHIEFPNTCQGAAKEFVFDLVQAKPEMRLPVRMGGVSNIHNHAWYQGFDWQAFQSGSMTPPYKPAVKSNRDMANFKANNADRPAMVKYVDDGSGWDKGFATCHEKVGKKTVITSNMDTE